MAVTILWTAGTDDEFDIVQSAAQSEGATLLATTIEALATCVAMALERGGVVVVTAGGSDATYAFRLGVDEVLSVGQVTQLGLVRSIGRARSRARGRLGRLVRSRVALADVTEGMTLLTSVLDRELSQPLLAASDACNALRDEFDRLVQTAGRLEQWAALVAPPDELRAVASLRAQFEAGSIQSKLQQVRFSLVRAEALITLLGEVSALEARKGCVLASSAVRLLRELIARQVGAWATLRVVTEGECVAQVPRPVFVCILSALVARALSAVRASSRTPGEIEIRVSEKPEQEATILVEVFDTGEPEAAFGPEILRGSDHAPASQHPLLSSLRDRARQFGGELLVESDETGTTVRLLLPTPSAQSGIDAFADAEEPPESRALE